MIQGFKEFILKGNVIDLAVAVVIGAAFSAIVTTLVDALINPLIGAFLPTGDLSSWVLPIPGLFGATANIGIGAIISAIISFLSIALVVYLMLVMPMNKVRERQAARAGTTEEPEAATETELLVQIRDLLERNGTPRV